MMNRTCFICMATITVALFLSSCIFEVNGIVGKGSVVEQSIRVADFTTVSLSSSADVEITKGESLQVTLSDYENLIDSWDIKVQNGALSIGTKPFTSLINSRAKVKIVLPTDLYEAKISGSGNMDINSEFPELEKLTVTGSGTIYGNANTVYSKLYFNISGSGSIDVIGSVDDLRASTTGSGKMYLYDLIAKDATCIISGSGDMFIHATTNLNANITGSGSIRYEGNPIVNVHASGSGIVSPK